MNKLKKALVKCFIIISCLFLTFNSYSQLVLDTISTKPVLKVNKKEGQNFDVQNFDILKADTILTVEHKSQIEKVARSTPFGDIFWAYFGEIIISGITLLLIYIRVTVVKFFTNVYEKITKKEKEKNTYTNEDIKKLGELSEDINEYLTEIKEMTKAKRVLLYQFSNGSHFFSNTPVLRMTVTNYSEGDNIKNTDNVFNYVTAKEIVHQILNDEYLEVTNTNTENKYCGYVSYLRFAKFKSSTLIRVNVSDNYCGVIEIIQPETFDLASVRSYCISIGHLFDRYNREKTEQNKL